jgi:esterase
VKLHVAVDGPRDGTPVVLLHGVSGSSRTYDWLPDEVVRGRRVVRIDLRGHGRSERAPDGYAIADYGGDVVAVLREVARRPAVLVGHSLGGVTAWWVAQRHRELVAAAFLEDPPLYMGELDEHERNGAVPVFPVLIDTAARWRADGVSQPEAAAELAAGPLGPTSHGDALAARAYALRAMDPGVLEGAIDRSTLAGTDTSSPVDVPVFILAADDAMGSAFPTRHAERLARTHPGVEVVRVRGAGHSIHDEREHRPAYTEHLTRFLAVHADGS